MVAKHLTLHVDDDQTVCGQPVAEGDVHGIGSRGLLDVTCRDCKRPVQDVVARLMQRMEALGGDTDG